jgi:hypothetical protein
MREAGASRYHLTGLVIATKKAEQGPLPAVLTGLSLVPLGLD